MGIGRKSSKIVKVRQLGGRQKKPFLKVAALVAMVTTAACSRPGASFSYKNVAKKE